METKNFEFEMRIKDLYIRFPKLTLEAIEEAKVMLEARKSMLNREIRLKNFKNGRLKKK